MVAPVNVPPPVSASVPELPAISEVSISGRLIVDVPLPAVFFRIPELTNERLVTEPLLARIEASA